MLVFWVAASVVIARALAFVLSAMVAGAAPASASRTAVDRTAYRDRRSELQAEHAAENIGDDYVAAELLGLDRELLRDADGGDDAGQPRSAGSNPYPPSW